MLKKRIAGSVLALLLIPLCMRSQSTTSSIEGSVKTNTGEPLVGAALLVIHEPTGTVYRTQSRNGGRFDLNNLNPGGPYTLELSFVNFVNEKRTGISLTLGEVYKADFTISPVTHQLGNVVVTGRKKYNEAAAKGGMEATIDRDKMADLPSIGRTIYDYLKAVPMAKLIAGNEGAISIAGQNNRYNAFYVDGAINNDVFGLAASGTNGGQAAISPVSIDAIDQFQILISPYDAAQGHFTGGGINAITRSGTNKTEGSVYYFLQNQDLAGKTPTGPKELAVKLSNYSKKTYGFRMGGALVKNRLFYFVNADLQRDIRPQPFDFSNYTGNTKDIGIINGLVAVLRNHYGYDPGGFMDNPEKVNADRLALRFDWNINNRHKLTITNRYTNGRRYNTSSSSSSAINFYNNGYLFPTKSNSASAELKSFAGRGATNKLLVTYTAVSDDRSPLGQDFPRVRINDGPGAYLFGTDNSSAVNLLQQYNWTMLDEYRFTPGKHGIKTGMDIEYSKVINAFIQNAYGNYTFTNLNAFLFNQAPSAYSYGFSGVDHNMGDHTEAAARFGYLSFALFLQDEYRANNNLTLHLGLRADYAAFLNTPEADEYTNSVALPQFSKYWDLKGARSGARPELPVSFSPRVGFTYKTPEKNITLRGGLGLFSGRLPLVWPGGIYNNNGIFTGEYTANANQLSLIRFRPDPYHQWNPVELGIAETKGTVNLLAADFRMPKIFRASFAVDRKWNNGWSYTLEGYFTRNINEISYTNINLLPPFDHAVGPDTRSVYTIDNNGRIPVNPNGTNPYEAVILLGNNRKQTGYSYGITGTVKKYIHTDFTVELNYSYNKAMANNDGTSSVNLSQWRQVETVNGRNYITRSVSDFSGGHRVVAYLNKKFSYAGRKLATTITLSYTGQSGTPFSYVYGIYSMTRDDGATGGNDLMYIPTSEELAGMIFLNNTVIDKGVATTYTPQQQKDALEVYILQDPYLRSHRGRYTERNGGRLPFTNIIDMKIAQDVNCRLNGQRFRFQLTYDIFNLGNLLNRNWGRQYFMGNDQFSLLSFAGYVSATNLTPQYRFTPTMITPYGVSTSTNAAYAARWMSQLGIRLIF